MSSVLSIAASGMAAAQKRLEVSARNVANVSARPSVDLAGEAVQQMVARYTFAANAKVAKLAGEMQKALLDVKA